MTWLLSMWCLSYLSYVNSAVIFWNYFFVHVWFGMSLSKIRSHGGTGGQCGTTMNVANLSELFCSRTAWREKERERERESYHQKSNEAISATRKDFFANRT